VFRIVRGESGGVARWASRWVKRDVGTLFLPIVRRGTIGWEARGRMGEWLHPNYNPRRVESFLPYLP
jgi:hypothetical protein